MRDYKTRAFEAAKRYMRERGKPTKTKNMSNADKILFAYVRSINEKIFLEQETFDEEFIDPAGGSGLHSHV